MEKLNVLENITLDENNVLVDSSTFNQILNGEKTDYSKFEVNHGYGKLLGAGVRLSKGSKGTFTVDIKVKSFNQTSYKATIDELRTHLNQTVVEHLDECEKQKRYADWWLWFHSGSASEYEHHKNQHKETITDTDEKKTHALEENFAKDSQEYHVSGTFQVEGLSNIPTEVFLFVEMLNIKTSNGNSMNVINSNAVAASGDGDTSAAKVDGDSNLNIMEL